jgi:hypothetical protein
VFVIREQLNNSPIPVNLLESPSVTERVDDILFSNGEQLAKQSIPTVRETEVIEFVPTLKMTGLAN